MKTVFYIYNKLAIAASICEFSKESKYICVIFSELCPKDSEIIDVDTPERFRTVANEWRAT